MKTTVAELMPTINGLMLGIIMLKSMSSFGFCKKVKKRKKSMFFPGADVSSQSHSSHMTDQHYRHKAFDI